MRRRVNVERAEALPEPAHVRLAAWRARTVGLPEAEPVSWMTEYRTRRDAGQAAVTAALRAERAALQAQLVAANDAHYLRATRALALVDDEPEEAVA